MAGKRRAVKVSVKPHGLWTILNRLSMSQNELPDLVGTSSSYISQMVNGQRFPSGPMRRRMLKALGDPPFDEVFIVVNGHDR